MSRETAEIPIRRLPVLVRETRCGDGIASRELKIFCRRQNRWFGVQECTGCEHCQGFSLDPAGRHSTLECDWAATEETGAVKSAAHGDGSADTSPISEIMTKDVICVMDDLSVEELMRLFLERGISGVPVVDASGRAVGVVSKTDLVRQCYEEPRDEEDCRRPALQLHDSAGAEYDLGAGFHDVDLAGALVRDIMTPVAYTLRASTPIAQAAALMAFEGIHRLPITADTGGEIIGLLSALDVLRWLGESHAYLRHRDTGEDPVLA
jgi:CBS domain-containing protein